jgi:hypothetical protein
MLFKKKTVVIAAVFFALGASLSSAQPGSKGKSTNPAEVEMLRTEVARLRADLDAALCEIAAMKLAMNGGKTAPEEGQLFRGRSARHWLEQLKDADDKTREAGIEAIGGLARKNKKGSPSVQLISCFRSPESIQHAQAKMDEIGHAESTP